jgi:hypothetical protein
LRAGVWVEQDGYPLHGDERDLSPQGSVESIIRPHDKAQTLTSPTSESNGA